jgi:hypothetical protein
MSLSHSFGISSRSVKIWCFGALVFFAFLAVDSGTAVLISVSVLSGACFTLPLTLDGDFTFSLTGDAALGDAALGEAALRFFTSFLVTSWSSRGVLLLLLLLLVDVLVARVRGDGAMMPSTVRRKNELTVGRDN